MYQDYKWQSLDGYLEERGLKFRTHKAKMKWVETNNLELQNDADGTVGVAIPVNPVGVMNMRRGRRLAIGKEKQTTHDNEADAEELFNRVAEGLNVNAASLQASLNSQFVFFLS